MYAPNETARTDQQPKSCLKCIQCETSAAEIARLKDLVLHLQTQINSQLKELSAIAARPLS
jgi:hypothetical protein